MSEIDPTGLGDGANAVIETDHVNGHAGGGGDETGVATGRLDELRAAVETVADEAAGEGEAGAVEAVPEPEAAAVKALVRGRYRSAGWAYVVELRVDVDGRRPMKRLSADFYAVSGATTTYFGSMRVDVAQVVWTAAHVTITGTGAYTWGAAYPKVRVRIPRVDLGKRKASATLRFYDAANQPGAKYVCKFASVRFRSVLLEEDRQSGVTPFAAYDTGSLPSGGPARKLSVVSAYAEAGIQMLSTGKSNVISTAGNPSWSDAELHSAMQANFPKFANVPQWAMWLMHAKLHDLGAGLYGIMFDQHGKQRQGSAVFYESLAGASAAQQRLQLYTCVHEVGHGFNLLHSWQKSLATPPAPNRPDSPSWMNYPWNFPGGPAAFWAAFPFQFDDQEVVHLRHAFRDNVIMGGNPFSVGSGLGRDAGWADPEQDDSGLRLEVTAPRSVAYGVPVSVDLALHGTSERGRIVPTVLGPRPGTVDIAIRQPNGNTVVFAPLMHHCRGEEDQALLRTGDEPVRDSAFIHYGEDGFVFDQPGLYKVRARYAAQDGSNVLSRVITVHVQGPVSQADNEVAELVFGDEQGTLMSVLGSDDPGLRDGNAALLEIIERHPEHDVAAVARIVVGTNAAREFKAVQSDGSVIVRPPAPEEAAALLAGVFDVDAVRESAAGADGVQAARLAAAGRLPEVGTHTEVSAAVDAFIRSRSDEIATEVSELA